MSEENKSEDIRKMDKSRKKKKTARAALSFIIMAVLLVVLIFASVNIGSLQVSPSELFRGLFIERIEYPGVRHVFHSRDEFYFMVDAVFPEPVHNQCGVVGLVPSFPVRPCPVRRPFTIVDGICRCAENHVALRIFFEVSDEAAHGRALKRGIGVYVRRKCFRGDKEGDGAVHHSVCESQEFFRLFFLCHPTEFVIRVDIRL